MCGRDYEDGHSNRATPVPFPNTEVKPIASGALVSEQRRNTDAVFFILTTGMFLYRQLWRFL